MKRTREAVAQPFSRRTEVLFGKRPVCRSLRELTQVREDYLGKLQEVGLRKSAVVVLKGSQDTEFRQLPVLHGFLFHLQTAAKINQVPQFNHFVKLWMQRQVFAERMCDGLDFLLDVRQLSMVAGRPETASDNFANVVERFVLPHVRQHPVLVGRVERSVGETDERGASNLEEFMQSLELVRGQTRLVKDQHVAHRLGRRPLLLLDALDGGEYLRASGRRRALQPAKDNLEAECPEERRRRMSRSLHVVGERHCAQRLADTGPTDVRALNVRHVRHHRY